MKYKVGDLAFYTSIANWPILGDSSPFWALEESYLRPYLLEEIKNAGIITQRHKYSDLFFQSEEYNVYIWYSQQTEQQLLMFECELTSADEYATLSSYGTSFISPLGKKPKHQKNL